MFRAKCYKAATMIVADQDESKIVMAIFEYAARSNLLEEDVNPIAWLKKMQPICAKKRAATNKTLTFEGVVKLQVEIGWHVTYEVFGVASKLAAKMIPETAFIDKKLK